MHFKNYRAKAELTFTPRREKHMIVVGFVGKTQSIVVGFVVKAQRIVVECLRLDSGLRIITVDFAQSLQASSLRQQQVLTLLNRFHPVRAKSELHISTAPTFFIANKNTPHRLI